MYYTYLSFLTFQEFPQVFLFPKFSLFVGFFDKNLVIWIAELIHFNSRGRKRMSFTFPQ